MARKVLPSIETGCDPLSASSSVLSDDTYREEEGTPEPDEPEARLIWGRKHYGEDWYLEEVAGREAAREARCEKEERERIEDKKVEEIRKLQETEPREYARRIREYNLQLQGLTKAQIDKSSQPLSEEVIRSNWKGFSALLKGKVLQPAITNGSIEVSRPRVSLRLQKSNTEVSRKICYSRIANSTARDRTVSNSNRFKRPTPTLARANAANVKVPQSKHGKTRQQKAYKGERTSRRLANLPAEYGIFANLSIAPVPKDLQRNPSTRKRNPASSRARKASRGFEI